MLPLSVKCVAFVIGATVTVEMEELGGRVRSALRLGRPVPAGEGASLHPGWSPSAQATHPFSYRPGAATHG